MTIRFIHVCLVLMGTAQTGLPPLPTLSVDSFPQLARQAIARVARDAAARPDRAQTVGAFATVLHAWELWEPAHQAYERVCALDPQAFEWRYLNGVVLQRLGRHAEAVAHLRRAVSLAPAYLPARARLADALLESGRLDESEQLFGVLRKEPATEPIAELGQGRIAAIHGQHQAAVQHLQRAVALFPELGAAHYALALSYRALGRGEDARRALALHVQYGPRWPALEDPVLAAVVALKDDARATVRRGTKLAEAGDVAGAIAAHEAALTAEPSLADAHANLISLYGRARNWAKADEHYRALVALGVNLGDAHYDYGVLLGLQEKWELAADAYRQAIAVNPSHARAHNNLGQILEREGRVDEAATSYRHAVDSQPTFRLARFNLARMLLGLGRALEAIVELEKLTEPRDSEAPRYLFALAAAHVRAGHTHEGITLATDARRLALEYGQHELAAAIARDLALLKR